MTESINTLPVELGHDVRIDQFGGEWLELVALVESVWPLPSQEFTIEFIRGQFDNPESLPLCLGVYQGAKLIGFNGGSYRRFRVAGQPCSGAHYSLATLDPKSPVIGLMRNYVELGCELMRANRLGLGIRYSNQSSASNTAIEMVTQRFEGYKTFSGTSHWAMIPAKKLPKKSGEVQNYKGGHGKYLSQRVLFNDTTIAYDWSNDLWDEWFVNASYRKSFFDGERFLGGTVSKIRTQRGLIRVGTVQQVCAPSENNPILRSFIFDALNVWAKEDQLDMIYIPIHNLRFPKAFKNLGFTLMPREIPNWFIVDASLVSSSPEETDWKTYHVDIF